MSFFDDALGGEESIFKNDIALDPSFVPKLIPYRENEQHTVAGAIKPLFEKKNGRNLIIFGSPGIGKTVATKHVLDELEEKAEDMSVLFINCWKKNTSYKIITEICNLLNYPWAQNKRSEEILGSLISKMNKTQVVFVLDEADQLEDLDFLYHVVEDIYRKTLILIVNDEEWINSIDERVKSRLMLSKVEFKKYSLEEIYEILKQRVGYAFYEGVIGLEEIKMISDKTFEIGDLRVGLFLLKESGNIAEARNSRKISKDDVSKAIGNMVNYNHKELDEDERQILELIKQNPGLSFSELHQEYVKSGGDKTERTLHRKVSSLIDARAVRIEKDELKRKFFVK